MALDDKTMTCSQWYGVLPPCPIRTLAEPRAMCQRLADETSIRDSHMLAPWIARYALRLAQSACEVSYTSLGEYYLRYISAIRMELSRGLGLTYSCDESDFGDP